MLLYVSTTEALPAWSFVNLHFLCQVLCTGSAPHVQLICPCSAIGLHLVRTEGTRERLFLYASLTCPVSLLLSDCHGFVLSGLFEYLH